ncbi:hypothetical protein M569_16811, partial [Genlisea aurea]
KDASFLFGGITFDRRKFAKDFARFQEKKGDEAVVERPDSIEGGSEIAAPADKKRKRKAAGKISLFAAYMLLLKCSKKPKAVDDAEGEDEIMRQKKEYNRQTERDTVFRKRHGIHVSGSNIPPPIQNFAELGSRYNCKSYLLKNLSELGFKEPTPIQMQAIPVLLSGRECFACAPTGSGKTFAFICPILMKLKHASKDGVRAVILCPTRELAAQTVRECRKLTKGKKFYVKLMTKKLAKSGDFSKVHCDILISTPYRVQYAVRKRKLDLTKVEFLVLDESDKLFELDLIEQVDAVVKACSNPHILRSLFSATLPDTVEELARTIMHDAVRVIIGRKNSASVSIMQKLVFVGSEEGKLIALRQSFSEVQN